MKTPGFAASVAVHEPIRLQALADAIFAIAMTILVLELSLPLIMETSAKVGPTQILLEIWPRLLMYGLSFLILGMFWLIHHMVFDAIKVYDTTLVWINIIFLMFIVLIPFSTSLFGTYGVERMTALVYGCNILLSFGLAWALYFYSTRHHRLIDSDVDPDFIKGGNIMGFIYFLIILIAVCISFISPIVSFFIYGLIVVVFIVATMLGKWWVVTVWPVARKMGEQSTPDESSDS